MLFDWLVVGQVVPSNPAESVRGPKHVVKKGKTPVLTAEETPAAPRPHRRAGRRGPPRPGAHRAMVYSFARVGAVLGMNVEDYYPQGKRWWFRLHEKGGKQHEMPAHHKAEAYLDAYIEAAGIAGDKKGPLFRTARGRPGRSPAARCASPTSGG